MCNLAQRPERYEFDTVIYAAGIQVRSESSHCSSANVVPFIWWYTKVVDWSTEVVLASLVKGNELFGSTILWVFEKDAGCVPLIHIALFLPNNATSD